MSTPISPQQQQQYRDEGYFILERCIPPAHLELLREECARFIALIDAEMERAGTNVQGLNHRGSRYFIANRSRESARLREFLFSELMADICRATLGEEAYLFWEQYVVKCAEVGMKFSWHQDSGYVGYDHRPYLSCWCALDDMTEENGTVYLLPYSRAGTRQRLEHRRDAASNDLVGYHGEDPGIAVVVPAGSIAVFSSVSFHRSGANRTGAPRRVYLAQYSAEPLLKQDGSGPWGLAQPLLKAGERVIPAS
jgi:ectoine hydroxylase-related dioxygenase (phytanoyl-CoA dioxygenase family)